MKNAQSQWVSKLLQTFYTDFIKLLITFTRLQDLLNSYVEN
jgi:hypothetical protein